VLSDHARLPGTDPLEPLRVEQFEAEREVVDAQVDEPVVDRHVGMRRQLNTDEESDVLFDRADERRRGFYRAGTLKASVQVHERNAGFLARRPAGFDDVFQRLFRDLPFSDVLAGRAEAAVQRGLVVPESADGIDVDAEVGALENADAGHLNSARRLCAVPPRRLRKTDRVGVAASFVEDAIIPGAAGEDVR
jgi:hypothetical protein